VYILPDADVLKHRSNMIRNFIVKTKVKVVVPRIVISELEKTKKDNQTAREVVRLIENYLAQGQIQILEKNLASLLDYAKEILIERNAQSVGTLVATILIMGTTEPTGLAGNSEHSLLATLVSFSPNYKKAGPKIQI
jgi:predicted ribonuclease YlaK